MERIEDFKHKISNWVKCKFCGMSFLSTNPKGDVCYDCQFLINPSKKEDKVQTKQTKLF